MKPTLHILFWTFTGLYIFDYFIDEFSLVESIQYTLFELCIFSVEFYINAFILLPRLLKKKKVFLYIVSVILLLFLFFNVYGLLNLSGTLLSEEYYRAVISYYLNHLLFIVISYLFWYFQRFQSENEKRLELEVEHVKMELNLLKSQISPHFLFNTLNNIYSMVITKKEEAPQMIEALSDILRYITYEGGKEQVALSKEIEIIEKYLLLQSLRFPDKKKQIKFQINLENQNFKVPPLVLLTIVENAFKHGDLNKKDSGFIKGKIECNEKRFSFDLKNSFEENNSETSGIGNLNIAQQLSLIYGDRYSFETQIQQRVFISKMKIDV